MSDVKRETPDEQEEWRLIPGLIFSGFYEASTLGRIKDNVTGSISIGTIGTYYTYRVKGVKKSLLVHRLVALAFLGECPAGIVVNHKDLNKHNNKISNLEYVTQSRNAQHAYDHYHNATPEAIRARWKDMIKLRVAGWTYGDIARQFSMSADQVRALIQASGLETLDDRAEYKYLKRGLSRSVFDPNIDW